jgi:hypothetical protein
MIDWDPGFIFHGTGTQRQKQYLCVLQLSLTCEMSDHKFSYQLLNKSFRCNTHSHLLIHQTIPAFYLFPSNPLGFFSSSCPLFTITTRLIYWDPEITTYGTGTQSKEKYLYVLQLNKLRAMVEHKVFYHLLQKSFKNNIDIFIYETTIHLMPSQNKEFCLYNDNSKHWLKILSFYTTKKRVNVRYVNYLFQSDLKMSGNKLRLILEHYSSKSF